MDNDLLSTKSLLKSYKRLSPLAQLLLTFNLSVVNEEFLFTALQRPGNQSSLTSLLLLSVRLNAVIDVFCAKPSKTSSALKISSISDTPSPN